MSSLGDKVQDRVEEEARRVGKRGGIGSYLAAIRLMFNNPIARGLLRLATSRVSCVHEDGREVYATLLYHALTEFSGSKVYSCPITARFISAIINKIVEVGIKTLHGDIEDAKRALKDPALRRGVSLVFEGLGLYGVTVPQKMPAPFLIVWNFTNMCNLRCKHCYQRADRPLPDELTLEEKIRLVEDLDRAGVAAVALSGGEPTIHPHFYHIVHELARRGIYAAVATNGWVFADIEKLEKAVKLGLRYVEVSVDSANPKKHDWFRGVPGAWQRAVKALENAVKLGVSHAMAVTVTKANIDEIDDILDLAESIGVERVVFFNFVPVGRGAENVWLDLDPIEREEFLRKIYKEMNKRKIQIVSTAPQYGRVALQLSGGKEVAPTHFYVGDDPIVRAVAEFVGGCGAGRIYAAIQPNGDVTPCVFLPVKVGNIREKSFREIWETAPLFKKLRNRELLKGFCGKCPYKYICGGCRARAYAYFGDPLAPDPGCIYNLKYWLELKKKAEAEHHIKVKV
jgi:radical SAM protein with 4Fe4S-binding SPASM domain